MELKFWFLCFVLMYNTDTFEARKSKIEERLEAVEHLVRGELYFVREKIETDKEERLRFMKKLEDTLKYLNGSEADIPGQIPHNQEFKKNLDQVTKKTEENKGAIQGLSTVLLHTRRGIMKEKKAGKDDTKVFAAQILRLENDQTDIKLSINTLSSQLQKAVNDQSGIITNQEDLIKVQSKIIDNQNVIIKELYGK